MSEPQEAAEEQQAHALAVGAEALGVPLGPPQTQQLLRYAELLSRWGAVFNLSAVRRPQDVVGRHLLDSLSAVGPMERWSAGRSLRVLDVGSGAGLPGLVIAVARPDWQVTTIDAVAKKVAFVRQAAGELKLGNLDARHGRVETFAAHDASFDLIVSRAFSSLSEFVGLSSALLAPAGAWLAMKGRRPDSEIRQLPPGVEVFHVEQFTLSGDGGARCLVWIRPH